MPGANIAVYTRSYKQAGYCTVKKHLNSQHRHYLDTSPEYYIGKAREKSQELHLLVQLIFDQQQHPGQLYRACDGLLRLHKTAPPAAFAKACEIALECLNFFYKFVERNLENKMEESLDAPVKEQSLPVHQNIRGGNIIHKPLLNFKNKH